MRRKNTLLAYLPLLFLMIGCNNLDHFPEPSKGDIIGYIRLADQNDNDLPGDFAGVRVVLEGANREVMSDASGKWAFNDVVAGTYEITFKKDGFADFKLFSVSHVGGVKPTAPFNGRLNILMNTSAKIADLKAPIKKDTVYVNVKFASDGAGRMFVGRSDTNSPTSYLFFTYLYASFGHLEMPISQLRSYGLKSGEEVSIKAYGSVSNNYSYFDPHYGLTIHANLSSEFKEVKFKMP